MIAFRCDRCGEHYDGEPTARIIPNHNVIRISDLDRLDLCHLCWGVLQTSIHPTKVRVTT